MTSGKWFSYFTNSEYHIYRAPTGHLCDFDCKQVRTFEFSFPTVFELGFTIICELMLTVTVSLDSKTPSLLAILPLKCCISQNVVPSVIRVPYPRI